MVAHTKLKIKGENTFTFTILRYLTASLFTLHHLSLRSSKAQGPKAWILKQECLGLNSKFAIRLVSLDRYHSTPSSAKQKIIASITNSHKN